MSILKLVIQVVFYVVATCYITGKFNKYADSC